MCSKCERALPLDADAFWAAAERAKAPRAERMPDEQAAVEVMFQAVQRLREPCWSDGVFAPKDGTAFRSIEAGSRGIGHTFWSGADENSGNYLTAEAGDRWPARPTMFRLYPQDEKRRRDAFIAAVTASKELTP
jgi:hypothetical protein